MKKTLSILLVLCMVCALLPFAALADNSGSCGEHAVWTLDDAGTLTISGTGEMDNYMQRVLGSGEVSSTAPWMEARQSIRKIVVSEGITSVGDRAFVGLRSLESVSLADSVRTIGTSAFSASSLRSVVLPAEMDSIGDSAFSGCFSLDAITMPKRLGALGELVFGHAEGLKSIVIPDGVQTLSLYLFSTDWRLKSVVIPASVKTIESEAFYACRSLSDVWFTGTEEQWASVKIGAPSDPNDSLYTALQDAAMHFGDPMSRFTDVPRDWAQPFITGAVAEGIMNGTGEHTFQPDASLTRAMVVTILWRLCGEPKAEKASGFADLTQTWYLDAIAWAQENKIVNGMDDTHFAPDRAVSRQDFVTILYRYVQGTDLELSYESLDRFSDRTAVSSYAVDPMRWAVCSGVISGIPAGNQLSLEPERTATRAQAAKMFLVFRSLDGLFVS